MKVRYLGAGEGLFRKKREKKTAAQTRRESGDVPGTRTFDDLCCCARGQRKKSTRLMRHRSRELVRG